MSLLKQILILLFCYTQLVLSAQEIANKNPKKAVFYSAIIPGSGQIYTEKYWKVPILGFVVFSFTRYGEKNEWTGV